MSTKLYVGNLPYNATSTDLDDLFSEAGQVVSSNIITDRDTGRSRGFGFVEMDSPSAAQIAIERFNGREFQGRNLVVNEAKPRAPRAERGHRDFDEGGFGGGENRGGRGGRGGGRGGRGGGGDRFERPPRW